ncbi:MAG: hypothetical protein CMH50_07400, partial [Myxococcales bacterium]|nr:hypothetical protein [Myxococcales bacterium]
MAATSFRVPLLLSVFAACTAPLPSLPEGETTREPTTIERVGEPLQLVAGDWGALSLQVLDQFGEPMPAQTVTARVVKAADQSPPLSFGLGNSCTTAGAPAQCAIDLRSEGPAGVFDLVLSSGGAADLSQAITVGTDRSSLSLQLTRPDQAEPALWRPGGGDGLAAQAPLSLFRGEGSRSLAIRLVDAFDNPLPAQVLQVEAAEAQAASLALHGGEGCPEDLSLGAQAEAAFGEGGLLRLCVAAGSQLGASDVLLTLPGLS